MTTSMAVHYLASFITWLAARRTCSEHLAELDARTLADLGLDRSEIGSVEFEARLGAATRRRIERGVDHA
jgi:uncharacterized protein YjiS (DUF1127 family)